MNGDGVDEYVRRMQIYSSEFVRDVDPVFLAQLQGCGVIKPRPPRRGTMIDDLPGVSGAGLSNRQLHRVGLHRREGRQGSMMLGYVPSRWQRFKWWFTD